MSHERDAPLDLRAVEQRSHDPLLADSFSIHARSDVQALVAHCRALRAALHDYMRRTGDGLCRDRHAVARNDAATVLAQAVDGEAAP